MRLPNSRIMSFFISFSVSTTFFKTMPAHYHLKQKNCTIAGTFSVPGSFHVVSSASLHSVFVWRQPEKQQQKWQMTEMTTRNDLWCKKQMEKRAPALTTNYQLPVSPGMALSCLRCRQPEYHDRTCTPKVYAVIVVTKSLRLFFVTSTPVVSCTSNLSWSQWHTQSVRMQM